MIKWKHPNWCQRLIADSVGLQGQSVAIGLDDDTRIVILAHKSHEEYTVDKASGSVRKTKNGCVLTG